MSKRAIFYGGLRTPFCRATKGSYSQTRPDDLLVKLFREQKKKNPSFYKNNPEDVLVGCAYPEGPQGYNIARMSALGAGLEVTGVTVNRLCASSLEIVVIAAARVKSGWGEKYLLGGIESMSMVTRLGDNFSRSALIQEEVAHAYITMGETAENVSGQFPDISREKQDSTFL